MTTESLSNPRGRRIFFVTLSMITPLIVSLALAHANSRMANSGIVSWSAVLVLTLMSSLAFIALWRRHDGFKMSAVKE